MAKFRKKPVVVEAVKYTGDNKREIQDFTNGEARTNTGYSHLSIDTNEGTMRCEVGDWMIKEPFNVTNGRNFYPCKSGIFEATYEPAE